MALPESLRSITGLVTVQEKQGVIYVSGVPAYVISKAIYRLWTTRKINANMFYRMGKYAFSFPSFFGVEILYMLRSLMEEEIGWGLKRAIGKIIDGLLEHTWLKDTQRTPTPRLDYSRLSNIGIKPLPTQLQFLKTYDLVTQQYDLDGYILSVAPGGGKTLTNLMLGECLNVDYHIVVSPNNALWDVWHREITEYVKNSTVWMEASGEPYRGQKYLVCHYETIEKVTTVASRFKGKHIQITLDESHHMNELTAKRTVNFVDLVNIVKANNASTDVVWSSGTPFKAMGYEVIPILRTIDRLFTPDAENRFRAIFGKNSGRGIDILAHRVGLISYKVTKEDIRPTKPDRYDVKVAFPGAMAYTNEEIKKQMQAFVHQRMQDYLPRMKEMEAFYKKWVDYVKGTLVTRDQVRAHELYESYIVRIKENYDPITMSHISQYCNDYEERVIIPRLPDPEIRKEFRKVRSAVKYLHLKIMGEALGSCLGKARVQCHLDMLDYIDFPEYINNSKSKTVIFTSYVQVLNKCEALLRKEGYEPVVVYGKTNKDLTVLLERFRSSPDANPILATYKSLSSAVPLVSASTTLFIDQPFRDYIKTQAESRTDRLGQKEKVSYFNFLLDTGSEPNISTRSNDILAWSKAQVEAIMGKEGSAVEIEAVDRYYESMESYHDGTVDPGLDSGLLAMESLLDSWLY